ncbi:hypothetical protein WPS_03370 [Vulcanimicrobium alpinum]|uniref:VWFA domain-containing protein n=1 Tax=Vulcanimicrobium alpinum TaxID=3016050 RepID=A0AAN1XV94_UNVUL|nr:VWA domain-containing protein [Vulcanimicrobium alpinum]BDE05061.1 hypothetical protein WPS_03370 [Vulcanimicrobium alpinum]
MQQTTQTPYVDDAPVTTTGFSSVEFAENPEPRCACILLLDTSGSMQGEPIAQLTLGLRSFKDELAADPLASKRVEIAVVTFGDGAQLLADFADAGSFEPPALAAGGLTPMGAAIRDALGRLAARKESYRTNGIAYYRPWIFLITDGEPTDDYLAAAQEVRAGEERGAFSFYAVGVNNANMTKLAQIAPPKRPPVKLDGMRFRDLFVWLSKSMRTVSRSSVGDKVKLEPLGWTTTQT